MKDLWKTIRLGMYVFALPLVATAAASAHQWMTDVNPVTIPDIAVATTTVSDGNTINTMREHTITQNRDGVVRGRLVSIDQNSQAIGLGELKVYFTREGKIVKEATTKSDGSFEVKGLPEGAFSFIAAGESGFAAYGVNVVSGDSEPTMMEVAAVSPRFTAVREILETRVPSQVADEIVKLAKANNENAAKITLKGSNRVKIVDGQLVGNIVPIWGQQQVAGTYVHIVKNDKQIAVTQVDESGHFQIPDIEPGVYDFVAAGPAGFAAVGFQAVQEGDVLEADSEVIETAIPVSASIPTSVVEVDADIMDAAADAAIEPAQDFISTDIPADAGYVDPSYNVGYADSFDVALTSPQDGYFVSDSVGYACDSCGDQYAGSSSIEYAGESVGCGAAAGGSCGGCGNFGGYSNCCGGGAGGLGGGGRLFKILGIAGFALGLAAIIGDDDGDLPVSPANATFLQGGI